MTRLFFENRSTDKAVMAEMNRNLLLARNITHDHKFSFNAIFLREYVDLISNKYFVSFYDDFE